MLARCGARFDRLLCSIGSLRPNPRRISGRSPGRSRCSSFSSFASNSPMNQAHSVSWHVMRGDAVVCYIHAAATWGGVPPSPLPTPFIAA